MAGFFYYVPGRTSGVSREHLDAAGLEYLPLPKHRREVRGGPDGSDGVIVALANVGADQVGYFRDRQAWRRIPGRDAWVGRDHSQVLPGPADLLREEPLDGHPLRLADGNRWQVPMAREWCEEDGELRWRIPLPRVCELGDDGRWQPGEVIPLHRALWELAERWNDARRAAVAGVELIDGRPVARFEFDDVLGAAALALQTNYVVGPAEISLAGLLTYQLAIEVLDAVIDGPTLLAWSKKKRDAESAGTSTSAGSAD